MVREIYDFNNDTFLAICFWKPDEESGFLSNWYESPFHIIDLNGETLRFTCIEQYFMWQKAKLFGDEEIAKEILDTPYSPKKYKTLGRRVNGFDEEMWTHNRASIMEDALYYKFTQNKNLLAALISTNGFYLVEASPFDTVWGIGMSANDKDVAQEMRWRGKNLLGESLMKIRQKIISELHN